MIRNGLLRTFFAFFATLFTVVVSTPAPAQSASPGKILGGWFEEWSIYYAGYNIADLETNGSAAKLSHLFYAFANVSASVTDPAADTCVIADPYADFEDSNLPATGGIASVAPLYGNFAEILKLKQLHPHLKTVISLGGASSAAAQAFSTAASTAAGREALAASCINMFVTGNVGSDGTVAVKAPNLFDGINIDWEFPTASDTTNFTLLLAEFRRQLNALSATTGRTYNLSFDSPAGQQNYQYIDLKSAAAQVDFLTIDGYNYAGSWETQTNEASPLLDSRQDPLYGQDLDIDHTVLAYLAAGVPAKKYLMGIPLYGAGWSGVPNINGGLYQSSTGPSAVPLADGTGVCTDLSGNTPGCDPLLTPGLATYATLSKLSGHGYDTEIDWSRLAINLYNPLTGTFYTYDNPDSAFLKALYVDFRVPGGLGGAYVWALKDDDTNGTMLKTLAIGLGRN